MNSILNLNTTWTTKKFLNYIKHNCSGTAAEWYDLLTEEGKHTLRMMETPVAMFKIYVKNLKPNSSEQDLIPRKKQENDKERLITYNYGI